MRIAPTTVNHRSIAASLFVCQYVVRTTKHRTIKLGGQIHSTKISSEFDGQGQRSKVKVTRDKKRNEKLLSHPHWQCIVRRSP